jgi:quinoprotein glucose dehydrogenase
VESCLSAPAKTQSFHAFDSKTGKLLWETKLPEQAQANPITYQVKKVSSMSR